jgi:hypothetical protein
MLDQSSSCSSVSCGTVLDELHGILRFAAGRGLPLGVLAESGPDGARAVLEAMLAVCAPLVPGVLFLLDTPGAAAAVAGPDPMVLYVSGLPTNRTLPELRELLREELYLPEDATVEFPGLTVTRVVEPPVAGVPDGAAPLARAVSDRGDLEVCAVCCVCERERGGERERGRES